jgi:hypothetical protein
MFPVRQGKNIGLCDRRSRYRKSAALKVPRLCPLVLVLKVEESKIQRWEAEKLR